MSIATRFFAAIDAWWRAEMPARRLATLRILCGGFALVYVTARLAYFADYSGLAAAHFRAIGVVSVLSDPLPAWATWLVAMATLISGLAFVMGWRFRWTGPAFAALLLWITTYRSSWGMIFHTENLLVLHVIVLAFASAADDLALDGRRLGSAKTAAHLGKYGWPIKLMCTLTVLAYLLAGIAKLRHTGLAWVNTDFLQNYLAYDAIRKIELGSIHSPLGAWLLYQGWSMKPLAAFSVAVELGAPLALLSQRSATVWAICIFAFHLGILALMAIAFPYPLLGVGLASFFPVEKLTDRILDKWRARTAPA